MSENQIEVEIEALIEGELTPARIEAQVKLLLASGFDPDEVQARITAQLEARHEAQFEAHLDGLDASTKAEFKAQVETEVKSQPQTLLYSDQIISDIESKLASSVFHGRGVLPPFRHSLTHGIPVAMLHFRSFLPPLLAQFTHFASHAASSLGIPISTVKSLPTQRSMWTVLKGPFVHKKKQENFERRVHKRAIKAWDADPEVVDRWVKYLQRHALAGVGMRVTRWERAHVGIGRTRLEDVKLQMNKSAQTDAEKVKALGQEIIRQELATPATTDAIVQMYTP
jgi:small subunit ribosomal protein S10